MADDQRESAKLLVALSSQLVTAKLAMLTMTGAIAIFVLTYKTLTGAALFGFIALVGGIALLFVVAITKAARGIYKVATVGATGTWTAQDAQPSFDTQTRLTFIGLIGLFLLVTIASVSDSRQGELEKRIAQVEAALGRLTAVEHEIASTKEVAKSLDQKLSRDASTLRALNARVEVLENRKPAAKARP